MRPALALFPLLFLFLFAATIESRKDPAEHWKMVMKDQRMPKVIKDLVNPDFDIQSKEILKTEGLMVEGFNHKCEESLVSNTQVTSGKDFEPRPNIFVYGNNDIDAKEMNEKVVKDFEPRPNILWYGNNNIGAEGMNEKAVQDSEPRPNISTYGNNDVDLKEKKKVMKDFEPIPNV